MNYKDTLMWQEIMGTAEIFPAILKSNEQTMEQLVCAIKESNIKNFVAAARGASNHAVTFFKYLLEVMSDYTVGLSAPSIVTLYKGKISYANSIVLGCSQSGRAEDVLSVIRKGNEQGAITIGITNDQNSPIAKEAKFHLYCDAGIQKSVVATKTFSAESFIFLWLASCLSGKKENIFTLKHLHLDLQQSLNEIDKLTDVYAEKFKDIEHGFVLSRGLTYPIALESSLLLQETSYARMSGYAGSDFYHGPIAMVNDKTPVIIYCAKNDSDEELQSIIRADQVRCVEKMLNLNAPVLLVTNDSILTGRFRRCNDAYINLSVPEEFAIFGFAIFAQMFACKISCLKGNNPDQPNQLDNMIITK